MSSVVPDAEALYLDLLAGVKPLVRPETKLVGITSGGAWLVERLQKDLGLPGAPGVISSAMHRDDFARRVIQVYKFGHPLLLAEHCA